jgi:hypothetical protein
MGELNHYCQKEGLIHQRSVRDTPQQNGRAERLNRVYLKRLMLFKSQLPKSFLAEAISTANYLRNIVVSRAVKCTPHQLFFGVKPNVSMLGCGKGVLTTHWRTFVPTLMATTEYSR